jgi:hypothetical protein
MARQAHTIGERSVAEQILFPPRPHLGFLSCSSCPAIASERPVFHRTKFVEDGLFLSLVVATTSAPGLRQEGRQALGHGPTASEQKQLLSNAKLVAAGAEWRDQQAALAGVGEQLPIGPARRHRAIAVSAYCELCKSEKLMQGSVRLDLAYGGCRPVTGLVAPVVQYLRRMLKLGSHGRPR